MTTTDSWLPLAEYSIKKNVSISTLRRRIKSGEVKFRFDDGKYFLFDENQQGVAEHRPSLIGEASHNTEALKNSAPEIQRLAQQQTDMPNAQTQESVFGAANRLLAELKKAYTQSLQEKEQQILALKQENVDLKTFVKILESENQRLHNL